MIFLYALARLHDAIQAVRDNVHVTVNLGEAYSREDRGVAVTVWGVHVQADTDGLMVLRTGAVTTGADGESCGLEHDPDAGEGQVWVVTPEGVRSWLSEVAGGRTVDDVMFELELAELGEGVDA